MTIPIELEFMKDSYTLVDLLLRILNSIDGVRTALMNECVDSRSCGVGTHQGHALPILRLV